MNFTLPLVDEIIDLKGGLDLRVDTQNARVSNVSIDSDHYKFSHTPKAVPQQPIQQATVPTSSGPAISISNECNHPIKLILGFLDADGTDSYVSLKFDAIEELKILNGGNPVYARGGKYYTYAESTDGSNLVWQGDEKVSLSKNLKNWDTNVFNMTTHTVTDPTAEKLMHTFRCRNS